MATIKFQTNVPVEVRMRHLDGKEVESNFGGQQHMFSTDEGVFYVSKIVGEILSQQFHEMGIRTGEPIEITKAEVSKGGGRKGIEWNVAKVGLAPTEQTVTTELERQLLASIAARKQPQPAAIAATGPATVADPAQPRWAQTLATQTKHLVDAYADVMRYAGERHGNAVKPEDIRAMMTTVFISLSKGGNANAA
jgi:hypothetical protein